MDQITDRSSTLSLPSMVLLLFSHESVIWACSYLLESHSDVPIPVSFANHTKVHLVVESLQASFRREAEGYMAQQHELCKLNIVRRAYLR